LCCRLACLSLLKASLSNICKQYWSENWVTIREGNRQIIDHGWSNLRNKLSYWVRVFITIIKSFIVQSLRLTDLYCCFFTPIKWWLDHLDSDLNLSWRMFWEQEIQTLQYVKKVWNIIYSCLLWTQSSSNCDIKMYLKWNFNGTY